jgi:thioredoxin reductase (NADPH)
LGFPDGISGADLAERARKQACRFGAEILLAREGVRGEFADGKGIGYLADGTQIVARSAICATGVAYRRLGVPNEEKYFGAGLYYGAGASEAQLVKDQQVIVVGGGNSAGQAALHFAPLASHVKMVIRGDNLKKTLSQYLIDRIHTTPNIEVLPRTEVTKLAGESYLEEVTLRHRDTREELAVESHWLFACLGGEPHTKWAEEVGIVRDEAGYLVTGPDLIQAGRRPANWPLDRDPYYLETNVPGVFAAGDVRHGSVKRCASAVGEGAMEVASKTHWNGSLSGRYHLHLILKLREEIMALECTHLNQIKITTTDKHVCEDCIKTGDTWMHLRMCLECGHVGCCDSSKNKHATKHFHRSKHPLIRSIEPGETWTWCYVDEVEPVELEV